MVVVSHLFLFYGKISGADVTWYESHLPLFGTIYFPIAPFYILVFLYSIQELACDRLVLLCVFQGSLNEAAKQRMRPVGTRL